MNRTLRTTLVAGLLAATSSTASAQSAGNGYLFHSPDVTLTLRGGYSRASAQSDVFDDVTRDLTLDRGDFSGLTLGGDFTAHANERLDFVISVGYSRSKHESEFRDFVDNNDLPIEQTTSFERIPVTASIRLNLGPTGRSIGQLAWIPNRMVPYVGAGLGAMRYRFKQEGDFVNFTTNAVFPARLVAEDWTFVGQGMAGVDYNLSPRLGVTLDARYLHAKGELGSSFKGYEKIDLSGLSGTVGLSIRL